MKKVSILIIIISFIIITMVILSINKKPVIENAETYVYKKDLTNHIRKSEVIPLQQEDPIEVIKEKLSGAITKLKNHFSYNESELVIVIIISEQKLFLIKKMEVMKVYAVSTSKYGIGNEYGSNKTPLGTHKIQDKIGDGASIGTIFKSKIKTGQTADITFTNEDNTDEDYVITRVLPLEGLEEGINRGSKTENGKSITVDSFARAIYIHGTPEEGLIGEEASHGCIRMINTEVIELFDIVEIGTLVEIIE